MIEVKAKTNKTNELAKKKKKRKNERKQIKKLQLHAIFQQWRWLHITALLSAQPQVRHLQKYYINRNKINELNTYILPFVMLSSIYIQFYILYLYKANPYSVQCVFFLTKRGIHKHDLMQTFSMK